MKEGSSYAVVNIKGPISQAKLRAHLLMKENCPDLTSNANPKAPAPSISMWPKVEKPRCSSFTYEKVAVILSAEDSVTVKMIRVLRARALAGIHDPVVLKVVAQVVFTI